jgi:hypothetical protein
LRRHFHQAVRFGDAVQLAQGELHAFAERIGPLRRGEAGLHAVEQREQFGKEAFVGELAGLLDIAGESLALVVEVGAFAQLFGADLLEFALQRLDLVFWRQCAFDGGVGAVGGVLGHASVRCMWE